VQAKLVDDKQKLLQGAGGKFYLPVLSVAAKCSCF